MLIVQKFGGTSVGTPERIQAVAARVVATQRAGSAPVVIVSAMAGETDRLLSLADAVGGAADGRERDVLLASGEQVSIALLSMALKAAGGKAVSFLGHQIRIQTDSSFTRARIEQIEAEALRRALADGAIPVIAGFQGMDSGGNITTLGRGGSDTSAVAVAASLRADVCEIYTDVEGVFTADPNTCSDARLIPRITYSEMMELASLGAKVLQIRAVELAHTHGVKLHVRSSFSEREGTMVVSTEDKLEKVVVTGVSLDRDQTRITVHGLPATTGAQAQLLRPLGEADVVIDMIVQNAPIEGRTNLSFTIARSDLDRALAAIAAPVAQLGATRVSSEQKIAKVSIVGVGMRSHSGVAQRMFDTLASEGIDILMISTSEIKVSCVIELDHGERAVVALHAAFGLARAG